MTMMIDGDTTAGEPPDPGPDPAPAATRGVPPSVPPLVAAGYLLAANLAVLLVDVAAVGGAREWIREVGGGRPALWIMLFEDGSPTELLQWSAIGAVAVLAGIEAGRARAALDGATARFWGLVGLGAVMMLMEDAGNVRHRLVHYFVTFVGLPGGGPWHLAVEAAWYAVIAGVLATAVIVAGRRVLGADRSVLAYGVAGAVVYAVAAIGSVSRDIGWWYADAGRVIEESLLRTRLLVPDGWSRGQVHFFLVDYIVEESLELLGASLLLAAVLAYRRWVRLGA